MEAFWSSAEISLCSALIFCCSWATWAVEYRRVGNGGGVPQTLDDLRAAMARLSEEGIEGPVVAVGHSAGGQIAALLACDKRYLAAVGMQPRDLAGMIGVAGAYAFLPFVEDEPEIFGDDAKGRYDSQPINFVDGDEPPMLLLQGTDDEEVPPNNAEGMAERAQAMDGTATLKLYPDVGHNGILLALARGRETPVPTLADTLAFIQRIDAASRATSVR